MERLITIDGANTYKKQNYEEHGRGFLAMHDVMIRI